MRQLKISNERFTARTSLSFEKYLVELSRKEYNLLKPNEEIELCNEIKKGNKDALDKIVKCNLRFVVSVAKQYQNIGLSMEDLVNEGNLGLIKAATRFDASRGFKFISYAVWWIRQAIIQSIAENARLVRIPQNKIMGIGKLNRIMVELEHKFNREPTIEEISEEMGIKEKDVDGLLSANDQSRKIVRIDAPIGEDDSDKRVDFIEDVNIETTDKKMMTDSLKKDINRILKDLPPKYGDVMRMYYGIGIAEPMSEEEIARHFEQTRERIRQIRNKVITKLRHGNRSKILKKYL